MNSLTQKVLQSLNPSPTISNLPDVYVELPAGLIIEDEVYRNAEVRELTGEHEELLAKAKLSNNPAKYVNTLLNCGVVSIGDTQITNTILNELLQGDLDTLMMAIRRVTFGDEFEVFNVACPLCDELQDLTMDLKDIPMHALDDPAERIFTLDLRKGRKVKIQFPSGSVQNDIFKKQISIPEMNSITLAYCVLSFIEVDGTERMCNGLSDVKKLGLADRKIISDFIYDNQPGPRYDQVVATCSSCEGEVPVPLTVGILFREL